MFDVLSVEPFDRIARLAARVLNVSVVVISFQQADTLRTVSSVGLTPAVQSQLQVLRSRHADEEGDRPLPPADVRSLQTYVALPLLGSDQAVVGMLEIADERRRTLDAETQRLLHGFSEQIVDQREMVRLMTEQERAALALVDRDRILEAAGYAAERFLRSQHWETVVDDVLARLGAATRVDRVYLFHQHEGPDGTPVFSQQFEWVAEGVVPQIDNPDLQNLPYREVGFGRWEQELRAQRPLYGHVSDFPPEEQDLLNAQDILSLIVMPVFTRDTWWGFVGFDDCRTGRPWTEPEVEALRVAAGTLGAAIQRKQYEAELIEARVEAENASRLKSAFLANMSHELRTPLSGILGLAELMSVQKQQVPDEYLSDILHSGTRLLDTLNAILDLTQLETGAYRLVLKQADVVACVREAVASWQAAAADKGLTLTSRAHADTLLCVTDRVVLQKVLRHLLSNAIKFTREGRVEVTLREQDGAYVTSIADTGPGIPADQQERVFEAFQQGQSGPNRLYEGSGLGLTVAHYLVDLMKGDLAMTSTVGEGTRITMTLPCTID